MKSMQRPQVFIILILLLTVSCNLKPTAHQERNDSLKTECNIDTTEKQFVGESSAKQTLERFLNDSTVNLLRGKVLIKDKQQLISIAEPILFGIYGKGRIIAQKPYEIYLLGDYWVMMGTLKKNYLGGTFNLVMNRKTAEIIGIYHDK